MPFAVAGFRHGCTSGADWWIYSRGRLYTHITCAPPQPIYFSRPIAGEEEVPMTSMLISDLSDADYREIFGVDRIPGAQ